MSEENKSRTVMLPASLWVKLKRLADSERRTVNAQIAVIVDNTPENASDGA